MSAKKKNANGVWKCTLYRFGYDLTVIAQTKEDAVNAMREEYIKTYAKINNLDEELLRAVLRSPDKYEFIADDAEYELDEKEFADLYNGNEFLNYYRMAFDDINVRFYEFGKVEWD